MEVREIIGRRASDLLLHKLNKDSKLRVNDSISGDVGFFIWSEVMDETDNVIVFVKNTLEERLNEKSK